MKKLKFTLIREYISQKNCIPTFLLKEKRRKTCKVQGQPKNINYNYSHKSMRNGQKKIT